MTEPREKLEKEMMKKLRDAFIPSLKSHSELLISFIDGGTITVQFDNDSLYQAWYWHPITGALVITLKCHKGCRDEYPASKVCGINVLTARHFAESSTPVDKVVSAMVETAAAEKNTGPRELTTTAITSLRMIMELLRDKKLTGLNKHGHVAQARDQLQLAIASLAKSALLPNEDSQDKEKWEEEEDSE